MKAQRFSTFLHKHLPQTLFVHFFEESADVFVDVRHFKGLSCVSHFMKRDCSPAELTHIVDYEDVWSILFAFQLEGGQGHSPGSFPCASFAKGDKLVRLSIFRLASSSLLVVVLAWMVILRILLAPAPFVTLFALFSFSSSLDFLEYIPLFCYCSRSRSSML